MNQDHILQNSAVTEGNSLQLTLNKIKSKLGFRSARAFYDQYLMSRTRLDFNYSYYMKIEGGKLNPSPQVISNLCSALEEEDARAILLSYCECIFPERASVFRKLKPLQKKSEKKEETQMAPSAGVKTSQQTYLTLAQIACLGQSKLHYYAFSLLTLARYPITVTVFKQALPEGLDNENVEALIEDFIKAKLIKIQSEQISSIANDMKFPVPESLSLKKLYEQMDAWSISFQREMQFTPVVQKMMLRRVSSRYLSVIEAHCNVMIDLIRSSDELDPDLNDEVLMLNVSIQKGYLPG